MLSAVRHIIVVEFTTCNNISGPDGEYGELLVRVVVVVSLKGLVVLGGAEIVDLVLVFLFASLRIALSYLYLYTLSTAVFVRLFSGWCIFALGGT